jgi:hypothetical protein
LYWDWSLAASSSVISNPLDPKVRALTFSKGSAKALFHVDLAGNLEMVGFDLIAEAGESAPILREEEPDPSGPFLLIHLNPFLMRGLIVDQQALRGIELQIHVDLPRNAPSLHVRELGRELNRILKGPVIEIVIGGLDISGFPVRDFAALRIGGLLQIKGRIALL